MNLKLKRAYDAPDDQDGTRVLVDRLWPRGLSKDKAQLDHWLKGMAPSKELRQWFGHDPERWQGFRKAYLDELSEEHEDLKKLREIAATGTTTLVFSAKDREHNNAVVLRELLQRQG